MTVLRLPRLPMRLWLGHAQRLQQKSARGHKS